MLKNREEAEQVVSKTPLLSDAIAERPGIRQVLRAGASRQHRHRALSPALSSGAAADTGLGLCCDRGVRR